MSQDQPRILCPRCGRNLRSESGGTCPDCGFVITFKRIQHRASVRYWRWLRTRHRWEIVSGIAALGLGILGCWILSYSPGWGIFTLSCVLGVTGSILGRALLNRQKKSG